MNPYDRLAVNPPPGVYDHQIGMEHGDTCGRFHEPDEDAPRGYKPKPCKGVMKASRPYTGAWPYIACDTCGEVA